MLIRAVTAIVLALAAISPAGATAEHKYGKREFATILDGRAPNGKVSIAAHGDGDSGNEGFQLYLMAEPGHKKLMALANVNEDNILDTAPDAFHATWSKDSRYAAVTFRSERHIVTLNLYAVDGKSAQ